MTATERLRALLDERGADYRVSATGYSIDIGPYTTAYANRSDTTLDVSLRQVTPEQAIAATLGAGTCRNTSKVTDAHGQARFVCSECRAWIDLRVLWNPDYPNGESPWVRDCELNYCPNCGAKVVDA